MNEVLSDYLRSVREHAEAEWWIEIERRWFAGQNQTADQREAMVSEMIVAGREAAASNVPRLVAFLELAVDVLQREVVMSESHEPELNEEQQADADANLIVTMGNLARSTLAEMNALAKGEGADHPAPTPRAPSGT